MLTALYDQFTSLYAALPDQAQALQLASRDAKQQEQSLYDRTTKMTYRNAVISAMARLKKRRTAHSVDDTGTLEQLDERAKLHEERERNRLTKDKIKEFVHDKETLKQYEYVVDVPRGKGGDCPTEQGNVRKCDRCGTEFVVKSELGEDSDVDVLHSRLGFLSTAAFTSGSPAALGLVALDCELVYTTSGMSLARVTVINSLFETVLDEHVVPLGTVLDTNERFSGVSLNDIESATLDGHAVRLKLGELIDENTIIVGHGLENDLKALRIVHDKVIDTAILYKHPNGGTWRFALRNLAKEYLGKFIQEGTAGHSAAEDSITALELVRHKMVKMR
ncbi:RNA exonuclease 3 [Microbotryomycetes sp. JL201]|nr:RNA exonuclease 3 [Microbotryomycetes sp. JL201]